MKRKPRLRPKAYAAAFLAIWALPVAVLGQANRPVFALQQVIINAQPGLTQADLNAIAAEVGATAITPLTINNFYKLTLAATANQPADVTNAVAILKVDARLRGAAPNYYNYPMQVGAPHTTTPNDPRYVDKSQWNMDLIRMPAAWVLQKGSANANAAICDSGGDPTHEDLIGQYLTADCINTSGDTGTWVAQGTGPELQHGVHVSGTIDAITNNSKGVAGICGWGQNVKILMCRVFPVSGGVLQGATDDEVAAGINYCAQKAQSDHIVSLNLSLGRPGDPTDTTNLYYTSIMAAEQAGINVIAAAGNDSSDAHSFIPAGYPFVVSVSATDSNAKLTTYSNFGKIDIAAPGGGGLGGSDGGYGPEDILSTRDGGYHYEAGTSMASPHVAGVVTLLRSVPGVTAQRVFDPNNRAASVLLANANRIITGQSSTPDPSYGYGLLDAYAALVKVSYSVLISTPIGIDPATGQSSDPSGLPPPPVESLRPLLQFQISNIPLSNVNITQQQPNGTTVQIVTNGVPNATLINQGILSDGVNPPGPANPGIVISGVSTGANAQFTLSFRYRIDQTVASSQQTIQIAAQPLDTTVAAVTDTRTFTVAPHQLPTGLNLVAIPYYETTIDSPSGTLRDIKTILSAPDATLFRWVTQAASGSTPAVAAYASNGTSNDLLPADATLYPADMATTTDDGTDVRPIGVGYFLKTAEGTLVATYGVPATSRANQSVHIPLREGWNMIGDPFSFEVAFSSTQIQTSNGSREGITDAVTNNLILPYIYNYTGGEYQFNQLPGGSLEPWQGHWIYVVPKTAGTLNPSYTLTLIVPPTGAYSIYQQGRGAAAPHIAAISRVSGTGSWSLQLAVTGAGLKDTQNFIGVSATATDGQDKTKAPKPPLMSPYVSLGLSRANGALYTQDLRALGHAQTWNMVVSTDQKNTGLTVTWPNITQVPRTTRLTLTDVVTGQTLNLRSTHSYSFQSAANAGARQFVVTATPGADTGRALLTSVFVNPSPVGRGVAGGVYELSYNLSRSAAVDVTVLGPTGRTIAVPQPTRDISEGANTTVWNGHDSQGRAVPAGPYMLQVRAVTPEGDVTRRTISVVVTR